MCSRLKVKGEILFPGSTLVTTVAGVTHSAVWEGFARVERLDWWARKNPGAKAGYLEIEGLAERNDRTGALRWAKVNAKIAILFLPNHEAKVITKDSPVALQKYFGHDRVPALWSDISK